MQAIEQPITIDPAWLPAGSEIEPGELIRVRFSRGERKMLRRKGRIRPSEWCERHIVLADDEPVPGKWKNRNAAYLAGIMDASFFDGVQEIIVCAPPQTGKSRCASNCIGYAADRVPGNAFFVFPDEKTGRDYNRDRLQKMFTGSPRLRTYLTGYEDDLAASKIKLRHAILYVGWANSAASLAWKSLPYGVADEEDKYPVTANKKEAGPVDLIKKRQRNYPHMRKLWRISSPTMEAAGIWRALSSEAEAVFEYVVKCPKCGVRQPMVLGNVKWAGGSDADPIELESKRRAWYECAGCLAKWDDMDRDQAVRDGEWRSATADGIYQRNRGKAVEDGLAGVDGGVENTGASGLSLEAVLRSRKPRAIGFHITALLSPFVSVSEYAAAFLKGLKDKIKARDFWNGFAGLPWVVYEKTREENKIMALRDERPRGVVPGDGQVAVLVAGVDTQDHGLWYRIRAFGWGGAEMLKESWGVREGYLPKLDGDRTDFAALEKVLFEDAYQDAAGNRYVVAIVLQDALGHRTSEVYDFATKHRGKVFPTVGRAVMAQPHTWSNLEYYPGKRKPIAGGLKALNVNTKYYKDELSRLLEITPGDPGAWHENAEFTEAWASHMTAEYTNEKGLWECPGHLENHLWDCGVLCLVAHAVLGVRHWSGPEAAAAKRKKRRVISSGHRAGH